jgi:hypothetical protein
LIFLFTAKGSNTLYFETGSISCGKKYGILLRFPQNPVSANLRFDGKPLAVSRLKAAKHAFSLAAFPKTEVLGKPLFFKKS